MIFLSTKTETALKKATENLKGHLKKNPTIILANVAYTLQVGQVSFKHKKVLICSKVDEAIEELSYLTFTR